MRDVVHGFGGLASRLVHHLAGDGMDGDDTSHRIRRLVGVKRIRTPERCLWRRDVGLGAPSFRPRLTRHGARVVSVDMDQLSIRVRKVQVVATRRAAELRPLPPIRYLSQLQCGEVSGPSMAQTSDPATMDGWDAGGVGPRAASPRLYREGFSPGS